MLRNEIIEAQYENNFLFSYIYSISVSYVICSLFDSEVNYTK